MIEIVKYYYNKMREDKEILFISEGRNLSWLESFLSWVNKSSVTITLLEILRHGGHCVLSYGFQCQASSQIIFYVKINTQPGNVV